MSAQTTYGFSSQIGSAGCIADLAPYAIDTFLNEEETGTMKFGVAVVQGTAKGAQVKLPTSGSTAAVFEGFTTNNRTTEYDLESKTYIRNNSPIGVMRYGRIFARVASSVSPAYGDALYFVKSGAEAGYATNAAEGTAAVKGRFLGTVDSVAGVAMIELFNEAQA